MKSFTWHDPFLKQDPAFCKLPLLIAVEIRPIWDAIIMRV